ncbi:hypothetical protein HS3_01877 [Bacillus subtilis]|nr:hypothetical protein HS3_01877 [Bacillus subtilis]
MFLPLYFFTLLGFCRILRHKKSPLYKGLSQDVMTAVFWQGA